MSLSTTLLHHPAFLAQYDTSSSSSGGGVMGMLFGLVYLALVIVVLIGMAKVFTKAGKPGWAVIVPIYNAIVLLEIAGKPMWWILLLLIPFVNFIILIIVCIDIAKRFGKDTGYGLGLAFLGFIFFPMLGFGDARYIGAGGAPAGYPGSYPPATM